MKNIIKQVNKEIKSLETELHLLFKAYDKSCQQIKLMYRISNQLTDKIYDELDKHHGAQVEPIDEKLEALYKELKKLELNE